MASALQFYDVLEDFAHKAVLGQPGPCSADVGVLCSKETLIMVRAPFIPGMRNMHPSISTNGQTAFNQNIHTHTYAVHFSFKQLFVAHVLTPAARDTVPDPRRGSASCPCSTLCSASSPLLLHLAPHLPPPPRTSRHCTGPCSPACSDAGCAVAGRQV